MTIGIIERIPTFRIGTETLLQCEACESFKGTKLISCGRCHLMVCATCWKIHKKHA